MTTGHTASTMQDWSGRPLASGPISETALRRRPQVLKNEPPRDALPLGSATAQYLTFEAPQTEVEEFFDAVVTGIEADELTLRTTSSQGEEAVATILLEAVPKTELPYLEVGVPARITIVVHNRRTRERAVEIRLLRPDQWYRPSGEAKSEASAYILRKMRQALGEPE
jgi:hypothetical protein